MKRFLHTSLTGVLALAALVTMSAWPRTARAEALGTLTLEQALTIGLEQNHDLELSGQKVEAAQIDVSQARSDFLPSVDAQLSASEGVRTATSGGSVSPQVSGSVSSSLTLYSGGSRKAALEAARMSLKRDEASLDRARESLTFDIASRYLEVASDAALLRVEEENLASQRRLEEQIQAFFKAGKRPVSDLYQQQSLTRTAELAVITKQRDLKVAKLELLHALGRPSTDTFEIAEPALNRLTTPVAQKSLDALLPEALERRQDVAAQTQALGSAAARQQGTRAGYLPTISAFASLGSGYYGQGTAVSGGTGSASVSTQLDDNFDASVGLTVSIPIFDRHLTRDNVTKADLERRRQETTLKRLTQEVGVELGQALEDYREAAKRVEVAESQLTYARQALDATQARYDVGASTLVELTQARASYVSASSEQVRGRYEAARQALAVLYQHGSIGGAFPSLLNTESQS